MIEKLKIRSANLADADELFAIRRDAIMALAEEYGSAAERWASGAPPDRAAKANSYEQTAMSKPLDVSAA